MLRERDMDTLAKKNIVDFELNLWSVTVKLRGETASRRPTCG